MLIVLGCSTNLMNLTWPFQVTYAPSKRTMTVISIFVFSNQWAMFAVLRIIHLMFLLKYDVVHLGVTLVLELGVSTLCVVKPYTQNFVMRLNAIRLHYWWYLVSLTIWCYTLLHNLTKKIGFYQVKVINVIWCPFNMF